MNKVTALQENEIFVFGSNERGIHGSGAALDARQHFGAELGEGIGRTGQCYAIPTKSSPYLTLTLPKIAEYVQQFLQYAKNRPHYTFLVTPIGTGLAGFDHTEIRPMFNGASENVKYTDPVWQNWSENASTDS